MSNHLNPTEVLSSEQLAAAERLAATLDRDRRAAELQAATTEANRPRAARDRWIRPSVAPPQR